MKTLLERFNEKYIPEPMTGCWLWEGCVSARYGQITKGGGGPHMSKAHRVSWELFRGPIPEGFQVLHVCDTPLCVNPDHLFLGTNADNMRDRDRKNRQPQGESHGNSKFTNGDIMRIWLLLKKGMFQKDIGKMFGVDQVTIGKIKRGETWSQITGIEKRRP